MSAWLIAFAYGLVCAVAQVSLWIESHQSLRDHPRKDQLAETLFAGMVTDEVADCAAVGLLHHLWWWALDYAQDGDLSPFSDRQIAKACRYGGEPRLLVDALTAAGFLTDDRHLHDWYDYAGRLLEKKAANAARSRAWRARNASRNAHGTHTRTPASRATRPNHTVKPSSSSSKLAEGVSAVDNLPAVDATATIADDGFTDFWSVYPRKVGKADTEKRWAKMTVTGRSTAIAAASQLARYASTADTELRFIPYPSTFIGPKRMYEDWAAGPPAGYGAQSATPKRDACPDCGTDLTFDEDLRPHCPYCGWRPT